MTTTPPTVPTLTPLLSRRVAALTDAIRSTGYTGDLRFDKSVPTIRLDPPNAAAQAVVNGWDWTGATDPAAVLKGQAANQVAANDAFLALTNPTAAQVRDHTRALARQNTAIIRRLLQLMGV